MHGFFQKDIYEECTFIFVIGTPRNLFKAHLVSSSNGEPAAGLVASGNSYIRLEIISKMQVHFTCL